MARRFLWASLALTPVAILARFVFHLGETALFVLAAAALVPLAWLIGEATEHAAEHTGPGIGGFLNASFGNAPELIIALFAVADGLTDVVRGSITGSIVSNILLVLGFALVIGPPSDLDRRSIMRPARARRRSPSLLFLVPSVPGFHGDPDRHSLALLTLPVAIVLLVVYLVADDAEPAPRQPRARGLRRASPRPAAGRCRSRSARSRSPPAATAIVSEILVHSLEAFAHAAHLSRVLHRGRDRRDRRQRGRARRRGRDREPRQDAARDRDRSLVERAGRAARRAGDRADLVGA